MEQNELNELKFQVLKSFQSEATKREATVQALSSSGMKEKEIAALTEIPVEEVKKYVKTMATDYQRYCEVLVKGFDDLIQHTEVPITPVNSYENQYKIAWDKLKSMLNNIPVNGWGKRDKEFITLLCSTMKEMEKDFATNQ